jgi:PrtD family type I secretion system ABC transporter
MRRSLISIGVVSLFVNLLMLTGPLYMLQVYDRVLSSQSKQTLLALSILVIGLYAVMAVLESIRSGMMARIAGVFESILTTPVFHTNARLAIYADNATERPDPVRDLDQCRNFLSGAGPLALFDLPWLPVYLAIVYLIHPYLGFLATMGAALLIVMMLINNALSQKPVRQGASAISTRSSMAEAARGNPGATLGMGMTANLAHRWEKATTGLLTAQTRAADITGTFKAMTKSSRLLLQSGVLGLGAYLALQDQISAGMMLAASIISARALAPVEQMIGSWRSLVAAQQAKARLTAALELTALPPVGTRLPLPHQSLTVEGLCSGPGRANVVLRGVSFTLHAGDGLGVIGTSGSGKTTLSRALLGIWPVLAGSVRLDGASIDQWDPEMLGRSVGFLPQEAGLFDGTVAQNIARFNPDATAEGVVHAARLAGVHELITALPDGYSTQLGEGQLQLSAGQRQRVGLARALYGDPFLVILDEPNANLDADGDVLLSHAISNVRSRGGIVIVIAHRPSAIASVDQLLVIRDGWQVEFGPKQSVLESMTRNSNQIQSAAGLKVAHHA